MKNAIILPLFLIMGSLYAQMDCYLGVGGKNDTDIAEIFQLDSIQTLALKNLGAELNYRNELLSQEAEFLLVTHGQHSAEDMIQLADKYRILIDSMQMNMKLIDGRLLKLFNDKQYQLYIELCNGGNLNPIIVQREYLVKKDSN